MTYQFAVALLRGLGGQVRQVRVDRLADGAYAATVEVEGPLGVRSVNVARQRCAEPGRASSARRSSSVPG